MTILGWRIVKGMAAGILATTLWPQVIVTPEQDRLRAAYVRAQRDFLSLDPALERELLSAPRDQVLTRIERSRSSAAIQSQAKVAYYQELLRKSQELSKMLELATSRPSQQLREQMARRRTVLAEEMAEAAASLEKLKLQRKDLIAKKVPAEDVERTNALIERAETDLATLGRVKTTVEEALASADDSIKAAGDVQVAIDHWKAIQQDARKQYEKLYESAKVQAKLWDAYHNDLKQIVVQHDGSKGK